MEYRNKHRGILSRCNADSLRIVGTIEPGRLTESCFVCCSTPSCCPCCSIFPCCGESEYITLLRESSSYIYVRENSLEWNYPDIVMKPGSCFGVDPCLYTVQDNVKVIYFDDLMFDRITDQTRVCNECRTCLCGGRGERVRIDSPICFNCCQRSSFPFPCLPFCCPTSLCPCMLMHEIYMEDAQKGLHEIKKVRSLALQNELYSKRADFEFRPNMR